MDLYNKLIESPEIYPIVVVQRFGREDSRWEKSTSLERELSLRHDYFCLLLTNTELRDNMDSMELALRTSGYSYSSSSSTGKGIRTTIVQDPDFEKLRTDATSGIQYGLGTSEDEMETEVDFPLMEEEGEGYDSGDSLDSDVATVNPIVEVKMQEQKYRYILLEGSINIGVIQNTYLSTWGCNIKCNKLFDIIDTQDQKLIEVKVTLRTIEEVHEELTGLIDIDTKYWSLITCNPETYEVEMIGMTPPPGLDVAVAFLIKRKIRMDELGINQSVEIEITSERMFFSNAMFTGKILRWMDRMIDLPMEDCPPNLVWSDSTGFFPEIQLNDLYEKLDKLDGRDDLEEMVWKGKILPEGTCFNIDCTEEMDKDLVEKFINQMDMDTCSITPINWELDKAYDLFNALKQFIEVVKTSSFNFSYLRVKRKTNGIYVVADRSELMTGDLLSGLGVGQKKRSYTSVSDGLKQPDYTSEPKRKYSTWMESVMRDLCKFNDFKVLNRIFVDESKSDHKIAKLSKEMVSEIINIFQLSNVGLTCAKMMNLMSRIGGSYLISLVGNKRTTHSSVAGMPIYATCYKNDEIIRKMSGILIRGPHHVKDSTDKVNFITVERVIPGSMLLKHLNKAVLIENSVGCWVIKQNSIRKSDPSFGAFLSNLMFVPANFVGEIFLNNPFVCKGEGVKNTLKDMCFSFYKDYYLERLAENLIMGLTGGSQEEGYFAIYRMVFMMLLAWSRGETVGMIDVGGLAKAMNECLISSSYALWLHKNLLNFMEHVLKRGFDV